MRRSLLACRGLRLVVMARQNRVSPVGELLATPERGLVYGNRGCLHDAEGRIRRAYNGRRWIACRLRFRDRRRSPLMAPGRYTELFFLDEVTALAAGHRPCAECRRGDYERLRIIAGGDAVGADEIDSRLHAERLDPVSGRRRLHEASFGGLPNGAMILRGGRAWLVWGNSLLVWTPAGYKQRTRRPAGGLAEVITPPTLLALLRSEWTPLVPLLHPTGDAGHAHASPELDLPTGKTASILTVRMTSKGQVTIPLELRERYGLGAGVEVEVLATDDGALIRPATANGRGRDAVARMRDRADGGLDADAVLALTRGDDRA